MCVLCLFFFFFKQKTAYEMRISDWSSDVCSSDLGAPARLIGVELAQLHVHLRGGDAIALQPCGIENDPDFAVDATASHDRCDAFYLEKALDDLVVDIPGQLLQRHRSEEHTSELQSLMRISYAVFCLKKK